MIILFYTGIYSQAAAQDIGTAARKGNDAYSKKAYDEALTQYGYILDNTKDRIIQADALYNKGLVFVRQNKLPEAAAAFKQSLRLKPADNDTRENLQKVLNQLNDKKREEEKKQQQDNSKDRKKNPQQSKPETPQNKLSDQKMEDVFNRLQQTEKQVQQQQQQKNVPAYKNGKDW